MPYSKRQREIHERGHAFQTLIFEAEVAFMNLRVQSASGHWLTAPVSLCFVKLLL